MNKQTLRAAYPEGIPPGLATIPPFQVQDQMKVLVSGPIPRNLGIQLVMSSDEEDRWEAMRALRPVMEPLPWLDMVLRLLAGGRTSPMPIRDELVAAFPAFVDYRMLSSRALQWWRSGQTFRVWRGAYSGVNERGMCWSLDPLTASRYATVGGCHDARPVLVEATVSRAHCLPHQLLKRELQVLADPDKVTLKARYPLPLREELLMSWSLSQAA